MQYSYLKSGTDVRGTASDLGGKQVELTDKAVYDITAAFAVWLTNKYNLNIEDTKIAVGHDSRITADRISAQVIAALTNAGIKVLDTGLSSTPAMFMTTVDLDTDAAVQITASHHPFDKNGLKFFTKDGGLSSSDIAEILKMAEDEFCVISETKGEVIKTDYMSQYAERLCDMIIKETGKGDKPLKNYKIVVDAGNGAGGFYAYNVLEKLGADITGSRFLEPDGMFPNHIPNPENKEAMQSICDAVKQSGADLGLIFDTDVDRAGCVAANGEEINRNRLIALASYIVLQENKGGTIVTDSVTSDYLTEYIEALGGKQCRYKRGYKNVIDKAVEFTNEGINAPLAIETSGHAALKENYYLDDGAYLVTKIVIELAKGTDISAVTETLKMPVEEGEYRFGIAAENFREYGESVLSALVQYIEGIDGYSVVPNSFEGVRVTTPTGWFLLRLSVHDPIMPLNLESGEAGGIEKDKKILKPFFEKCEKLNIPEIF